MKLEDVCLGKIEFSDLGSNLDFEIWSTYDGRTLKNISCIKFIEFKFKNFSPEEPFGEYIALVKVEDIDYDKKVMKMLVMESGEMEIKVICSNIIFMDPQ